MKLKLMMITVSMLVVAAAQAEVIGETEDTGWMIHPAQPAPYNAHPSAGKITDRLPGGEEDADMETDTEKQLTTVPKSPKADLSNEIQVPHDDSVIMKLREDETSSDSGPRVISRERFTWEGAGRLLNRNMTKYKGMTSCSSGAFDSCIQKAHGLCKDSRASVSNPQSIPVGAILVSEGKIHKRKTKLLTIKIADNKYYANGLMSRPPAYGKGRALVGIYTPCATAKQTVVK